MRGVGSNDQEIVKAACMVTILGPGVGLVTFGGKNESAHSGVEERVRDLAATAGSLAGTGFPEDEGASHGVPHGPRVTRREIEQRVVKR